MSLVEVKPFLSLPENIISSNSLLEAVECSYIRVPVEFSQALRLKFDDCCSDSFGNWECSRIHLAEGTAVSRHGFGLMLIRVVHERAVTDERTVSASDILFLDSTVQDVGELFRYFAEDGGINTKVLRKNVLWSVLYPVVDHESRAVQIDNKYTAVLN